LIFSFSILPGCTVTIGPASRAGSGGDAGDAGDWNEPGPWWATAAALLGAESAAGLLLQPEQ